jgi:hypothetical protein
MNCRNLFSRYGQSLLQECLLHIKRIASTGHCVIDPIRKLFSTNAKWDRGKCRHVEVLNRSLCHGTVLEVTRKRNIMALSTKNVGIILGTPISDNSLVTLEPRSNTIVSSVVLCDNQRFAGKFDGRCSSFPRTYTF